MRIGLKKADSYIMRKFLGTFFLAITLIIAIAIVIDFAEHIDEFMENDAPVKNIIVDYYINFIPYFINLFTPLFTFISVIFFTSKMAFNTEIIAILSSGVSFKRILLPYFYSAFIIALVSFLLNAFVIPVANQGRINFTKEYIKRKSHKSIKNVHIQINPGVYFYAKTWMPSSDYGRKITLEKFENGSLVSKLTANKIKWKSKEKKWTISDYRIREIDGDKEEILFGKQIDTVLNLSPNEFKRTKYDKETLTLPQLDESIDNLKSRGAGNVQELKIEKYKRMADPFATFILTLMGVSIASRKVRGGIGMHIGIGLAFSFSYILFMQISTIFATSGGMNALVAVWIPNILFAFIGFFLYRMAPK